VTFEVQPSTVPSCWLAGSTPTVAVAREMRLRATKSSARFVWYDLQGGVEYEIRLDSGWTAKLG
jgi:hypothetical protein